MSMTFDQLTCIIDQTLENWGVTVENSGIGVYEYWGSRCFDKGHDYLHYAGPTFLQFPAPNIGDDALDAILYDGHTYTFREGDLELHIHAQGRVVDHTLVVDLQAVDETGRPLR